MLPLEQLIPVPSPRNRANHVHPCLSWPTWVRLFKTGAINKKKRTASSRIQMHQKNCKKMPTSPGRHPMLTNAITLAHRRPAAPRDAPPETQLMQCNGPHFRLPRSSCHSRIGECGAPRLRRGAEVGPERGLSGRRLGGVRPAPGCGHFAVVTGTALAAFEAPFDIGLGNIMDLLSFRRGIWEKRQSRQ